MTKQEFVQKVLPVKDKLFRLAGRLLGSVDAEDVVQEVFYKLWVRKTEIDKYRNIEAFAIVITRNLCLDRLKSKAYRRSEITEWNEPVDRLNPERIIELKDDVDMVSKAMDNLPEQQRLIVQMRDIEEMEFDEIANVMQMNVNAVRVNLSRARKSIRSQLKIRHEYEYNGN